MSRIVYLNGKYYKESEAKISIFDRGLLFADSVYEVTAVIDNKLIDFPAHIERLENSLNELKIYCNTISIPRNSMFVVRASDLSVILRSQKIIKKRIFRASLR